MSEAVIIRDFRPVDLDTVLDIAVAAWAPIYAALHQTLGDELFVLMHSDWPADKKREVQEACDPDHPALVCVAEMEGRVVGFATYYAMPSSGIGIIGNNAVHPELQDQGIATKMYQFLLDRLRERGMRCVTVETGGDASHAPARRAYAKAGFQVAFPMIRYYRIL